MPGFQLGARIWTQLSPQSWMIISISAIPSRNPTKPSVILCRMWSTSVGVARHDVPGHFKGDGSNVFTDVPSSLPLVPRLTAVLEDSDGALLRELDDGREARRVLVVHLEIRVVKGQLLDPGDDGPPPVESGGQQDFANELLAGDRVHDVVALDLAHAVHLERGDVISVLPIDLRPLRREDLGEGSGENLEDAPAVLAARDSFDRLDLRVCRGGIDVDAGGAVAFMDGLRPPEGRGELDPVQLRVPELPVANLVTDERLTVALVRVTVEIAGTAVVAVTTLDVFRFHVPLCRQSLASVFEPGIPPTIYNRIFSAGRVRLEMSSYFGHCYRDSDGGRRPRHPPKSAAPSHNSRGPRGRGPRRRRMVCHLDLVRSRDGGDGARDVRVDGPRPLLRAHRRDDGCDDAAVRAPDGPCIPWPDAPGERAAQQTRGRPGNRRLRRPLLPRLGVLRSRGVGRPDGIGPHRIHARGPHPAHFGRDVVRRRPVAGHANEGDLPLPLHFADGLRAAVLAERSHRRDADGIPPLALLHRLLLAVHARPVHLGLDEPPLDGRYFRRDLRGETRRPHGPFQPSDRSDPRVVGRRGRGEVLPPDVRPVAARIPDSTCGSMERTRAFLRFGGRSR